MQKSSFAGYVLEFTQQAEKELKKIDKPEARRIKNKLESLVSGTQNMAKKKKYPEIKPQFLKNKMGKVVSVYLDYDVYTSIFEEIKDIKKKTADLKAKKRE